VAKGVAWGQRPSQVVSPPCIKGALNSLKQQHAVLWYLLPGRKEEEEPGRAGRQSRQAGGLGVRWCRPAAQMLLAWTSPVQAKRRARCTWHSTHALHQQLTWRGCGQSKPVHRPMRASRLLACQ